MNLFGRLLLVASIASSIALIASCDDGDERPRDCDYVVPRCRTVCGYYFCDSWGCYPSCYDQCWGECYRDPNKKPPGVTEPAPQTDAASPSDGGAAGAVLCAPCTSNDECKGGGLCIHPGGPPPDAGGAGDAGTPDAAPTSTGFCGYPCKARTECPEGFACAEIGTSKQCLPISGKCE